MPVLYLYILAGLFAATSMVYIFIFRALFNYTYMATIKTLKDFFYFYTELAYYFAIGYLLLIAVIIALSIVIIEQNDEIEMQRSILERTPRYTASHCPAGLLEGEYRMLLSRIEHR